MRIRISDTNNGKFSQQLMDHWLSQGHDVKRSMYYEHDFAKEADMYFFDSADMTVEHFCKEPAARPKKVIIRSLDIDLWHRYYEKFDFSLIDDWIFINSAWEKRVFGEWGQIRPPKTRTHVISCGVDTTHYSLRKDLSNSHRIAWIGRLWIGKGVADAIKIVREVNRQFPEVHSLHILGTNYDPHWWRGYVEYLADQQDFPIEFTEHVDDVGEWLEDKSHILLTSPKESFSYSTAEGMSKGLKPVVNDFWGSREIWSEDILFQTHGEAADMILGDYEPMKYRNYITTFYNQDIMFEKIDKLFQ